MSVRTTEVRATIEGLENRWLLSKPAPIEKFSEPAFYFNDVSATESTGAGTSVAQLLIIRNAGTLPLTFNSKGLRILGDDAADFAFVGKSVPATIAPGDTRTIRIAFNATRTGIETAILRAVSNDTKHHSVSIPLRGLGTRGEGGDLEPSLQQVLDLYQIPDTVGESNPNSTAFPVPPNTPNDEVDLQEMVKAGDGLVTITPLAEFANNFDPGFNVGWYGAGQNDTDSHALFSGGGIQDAQTVYVPVHGKTKFDPGSGSFGIYGAFPAFNFRKSLSEDALNTWEPKSQNRKKIRFYPMKNPDGSVVPNTYVFAVEDFNVTYDFNDIVGVITNVAPAPSAPVMAIQNVDGVPGNDRMVFNRITNLDLIRPNVVHDTDTLTIINSGASTLTIGSISLSDHTDFQITSGGGSNIKIAPHSTHNVVVKFIANPSTGTLATIPGTLTITSNDPLHPSKIIQLAGLWQAYSEQTPSHKYDEGSLSKIVNGIFGYQIDIADAGQSTSHGLEVTLGVHGGRSAVGSEVLSAYWQTVTDAPVFIRQLAAFHRQNNFDPVTDAPLTAASSFSWYYQGSSSTIKKVFTHNINEGQSLLPHLSGSTTKLAQGSFTPNGKTPFGFVVDKDHFSDDTLNALDFNPTTMQSFANTGHSMRFYPLIDQNGNHIPNTYLLAMDYTSNVFANWDYNDNIYIVNNIEPASAAATPMAVTTVAATAPASLFATQKIDPLATDSPDVL